jgi:hypothetical protein
VFADLESSTDSGSLLQAVLDHAYSLDPREGGVSFCVAASGKCDVDS